MRAMILAAGRGARMRPLTDHTPKPLLPVAGKPLIVWHLERLAQAGVVDIVINHAWLGEKIEAALGDGNCWGLRIRYSPESPALETAGGIARALPLLASAASDPAPFLVINGDVWCDWSPAHAAAQAARLDGAQRLAWLLLADNPPHHPAGDFALQDEYLSDTAEDGQRLTYTGIGVYHPALFAGLPPDQSAPLAPLLRRAIARRAVLGQRHDGQWLDVGTQERLAQLDAALRGGATSSPAIAHQQN